MPATVDNDALHAALESSLQRRFAQRIEEAGAHDPDFAALWRTTAAGAAGGKLLRPRLLVETFHELAGDAASDRAVIDIATAVELLHCSFLLHDDVIDGDVLRRGRPNVIGALGRDVDGDARSISARAGHWGRSGALLMGDLLLADAVLGFARADLPHVARARLLIALERVISETVSGELADVAFSDGVRTADLPSILRMTAGKTAVYSFELPLRAAAILADRAPEVEEALATCGRSIGLAYQLQDDLLSVFGDPHAHGKDPLSDLREGKETAIIAYARMTSAWSSIAPRFGAADLSDADAVVIRRLLRQCGAETFVDNLVGEHLVAAVSLLDDAVHHGILPDGARRVLVALVARITGRRS
ncbi:MAG: polyprenyl synthetase family protein [Microbacterium sp.]|nr:polyprenyl synthetase family protein [Microbacterium sp.]